MSIKSGYERIKKYRKTEDGDYIQQSIETFADAVTIDSNGNTLGIATASVPGIVKVGDNLAIDNGVLSGDYNVVSTTENGLAPKVTDTKKFLKGDGTWALPDVFTKSGSSASVGLVPKPSTTAGTSKFLCENGKWEEPSGNGEGIIADAWSATTQYSKGNYCIYNGKIWKCLTANTNVAPTQGLYWEETNIVNEILLNSSKMFVDPTKRRTGAIVSSMSGWDDTKATTLDEDVFLIAGTPKNSDGSGGYGIGGIWIYINGELVTATPVNTSNVSSCVVSAYIKAGDSFLVCDHYNNGQGNSGCTWIAWGLKSSAKIVADSVSEALIKQVHEWKYLGTRTRFGYADDNSIDLPTTYNELLLVISYDINNTNNYPTSEFIISKVAIGRCNQSKPGEYGMYTFGAGDQLGGNMRVYETKLMPYQLMYGSSNTDENWKWHFYYR